MHEVVKGAAQKSWGVHVARLAGVPEFVLLRAEALLKAADAQQPGTALLPLFATSRSTPFFSEEARALFQHIASIDPDALTPREAQAKLYQLQGEAEQVYSAFEEHTA